MHRNFASLFLFCAISLVAPPASSAAYITVPTGLNPGDQYRLAFVTSHGSTATSSDIAVYNAFVTTSANSVPELFALGTTWKAIASTTSVDARDNTGTNPISLGVPIYNLSDLLLAHDNPDLWDGVLLNYVAGLPGNQDPFAWTGSQSDGTGFPNNQMGASLVVFGQPITTAPSIPDLWTSAGGDAANGSRSLYGISGVITVVPEPSTMVLACLAGAGLAVSTLRRRRRCRT